MHELPSVAICIPTFNQAQYLKESVTSACRQTYPNVEVWVSDNASSDETPEVMTQLCQQFPQVRYYRQQKNVGMAANSTGILSQPTTEFVVRLDSDDAIAPHYVETLVTLMEQYPEAGYAHGAMQQIDQHGDYQGVHLLLGREEFQNFQKALHVLVSGHKVASTIIMYRAKVLRELGFYDQRLEYAEDYDLSVRIADAGYGNIYVNEVLSYYRVWTDGENLRPKRKASHLRSLITIYKDRLLPAFQRRGWDTKLIERYRAKMALVHAGACFSPIFNKEERAELITLLKELGDSPALRLRLLLLNWGFAPFLEWQQCMDLKLRTYVKQWLNKALLKARHLKQTLKNQESSSALKSGLDSSITSP